MLSLLLKVTKKQLKVTKKQHKLLSKDTLMHFSNKVSQGEYVIYIDL